MTAQNLQPLFRDKTEQATRSIRAVVDFQLAGGAGGDPEDERSDGQPASG